DRMAMDDASTAKRSNSSCVVRHVCVQNIKTLESEAYIIMNYQQLATRVLEGHVLTDEESLALLNSPDEDLLLLLHATYSIRSHYFGNKVKLNMIINTKSGLCPENCGYCAQSIVSKAPVEKYAMMKSEEILEGAERAAANKAGTYCIVASGRGPRDSELD